MKMPAENLAKIPEADFTRLVSYAESLQDEDTPRGDFARDMLDVFSSIAPITLRRCRPLTTLSLQGLLDHLPGYVDEDGPVGDALREFWKGFKRSKFGKAHKVRSPETVD